MRNRRKWADANKNKLSIQMLISIRELFLRKKWPIEEGSEYDQFNRFCERMKFLDVEEQHLMMALSMNYVVYGINRYLNLFQTAVEEMIRQNEADIINTSSVYIMPLLASEDVGKTKSSTALCYILKTSSLSYNPFFASKHTNHCDSIEGVPRSINQKNAIVILVDDFIGTGETAESGINVLLQRGIEPKKIVVVSLVAQEQGLDRIRGKGIRVYSANVFKRGISDYYTGLTLNEYMSIMERIEQKLSIKSDLCFGYKRSEALVTMNRTPNNTFPLFWYEDSSLPKAPFPRC